MMDVKELAHVALKAGEILLRSGAEIYRVEDTIVRICTSYNAVCESFALPTGIFISVKDNNGNEQLVMKRIEGRTVDLQRIELINDFSRSLQKKQLTYEEALNALKAIEESGSFNLITRLAGAGVATFVFTILFRGTVGEGLAAMPIGILIYIISEKISEKGFFQFFQFFISSMIAALISLGVVKVFTQLSVYRIIIGSIIILLPGVAITNSIKDALYGDIVSSMARLGEALLIATAIGAGVGIGLTIGLRWM